MDTFILQYKFRAHNERVQEYSLPLTSEQLNKTHKLVINMTTQFDPLDPDQRGLTPTTLYLKFNHEEPKDHEHEPFNEIKSINCVGSITLFNNWGPWDYDKMEQIQISQSQWDRVLYRLTKKLHELEVIKKYEQELEIKSQQRIESINEKIQECKKEIDEILTQNCKVEYEEIYHNVSMDLPKCHLGRFGSFYEGIDFYWNVNELINYNNFNQENTEDLKKVTKTKKKYIIEVPKINGYKRKLFD